MASYQTRYSSVVHILIVHFDISLDVLIMNSPLMLGHERVIVFFLEPCLLHLPSQLLLVHVHALAEGLLLGQVVLFLSEHSVFHLLGKLLVLELLEAPQGLPLVHLESQAFLSAGLGAKLVAIVLGLFTLGLFLLLSYCFHVHSFISAGQGS